MSSSVESFTYAIIGGGIAGVTCAEHLEIMDGSRSVVLVSGSDLIKTVTNVLHLSKSIDIFGVEDKHHAYLSQLCPSVTVKPDTVTRVDHQNKLLHLGSGSVVQYEKLCVSCGAVPKVPFPDHRHVLFIRDTESVLHFQRRIANARRIVIVGNGGIATEMVYEITGVEVVWAVKDSWFTATFIDPGAAEFFRPELTKARAPATAPSVTKRRKYTVHNLKTSEASSAADGAAGGHPMGGALGPDWHAGLQLRPQQQHKQHQDEGQKDQQQEKHDQQQQENQELHERHVHLETEVEVTALHSPEEVKDSPDLQGRLQDRIFAAAGKGEGEEAAGVNKGCPQDWPVFVELSNGKVIGCDFVVSATGVTPSTTLLQAAGGFKFAADGGVSVGEDMQTSVPGVYAAGDVCTPAWPWAPHWQQMRLWTQARQMGSYVAKSMWAAVTGEKIYQDFCFELFTHATKFFGHKVVMLGLFNGQKLDGKYDILLRMTRGMEYIKVVMKEGKMQGALLIGETDMEETFENLILNQMNLSSYGEDLLDPDIDIEDYFD